jgi:hypothetical protein
VLDLPVAGYAVHVAAAEPDPECPGERRFDRAGVGARVCGGVAAPDAEGSPGLVSEEGGERCGES